MNMRHFIFLLSILFLFSSCGSKADVYTTADYGNNLKKHFNCPVDSLAYIKEFQMLDPNMTLNTSLGSDFYYTYDSINDLHILETVNINFDHVFEGDSLLLGLFVQEEPADNLIEFAFYYTADLEADGATIVDYGKAIVQGKRCVWFMFDCVETDNERWKKLNIAFLGPNKKTIRVLSYGAHKNERWEDNICDMLKIPQP